MTSGDGVLVTRDGLAELGRYLVGIQGWVIAASGCLGVKP